MISSIQRDSSGELRIMVRCFGCDVDDEMVEWARGAGDGDVDGDLMW